MQLLHNMENKTILLVNDKYRKMEIFIFMIKCRIYRCFFIFCAEFVWKKTFSFYIL